MNPVRDQIQFRFAIDRSREERFVLAHRSGQVRPCSEFSSEPPEFPARNLRVLP